MTQRIHELFEYADGKLLWKQSRGRVQAGSEAGAIAPNGRLYVQVDGKTYKLAASKHFGAFAK